MKNYENEKQESGMRVLVVEPLKRPYIKIISDDLESLQREVGGDIEGVFPFDDPVAIVLNGEGKFNGSALNRGLYDEKGELYDIIAGTFLVTGLTEDDFDSISEGLAEKYMEKYKIPERFLFCQRRDYASAGIRRTGKETICKHRTARGTFQRL